MKIKYIAVVFLFVFLAAAPCSGARINKLSKKPAIVLAVFGTSHVSALPGILDIYHSVEQAFPALLPKLKQLRLILQDRNRMRLKHTAK